MAGFEGGRRAQDPAALAERLAEEFRLSTADMEKARAALEPAFALGLRHAMESPARWARLAEAFTAMTPQGQAPARPAAETFLDTIFGAGALREAVSRQAAVMTGISQEAIARMMPQLAAIGMETMMRGAMANWARSQPTGLATGDFGAATAEMMRRGANAVEALTRPSDTGRMPGLAASPADFFAQSFGQAFQAGLDLWTRGAAQAKAPVPQSRPESAGESMLPFAMMFGAFAKGMQAAADATPSAPSERRSAPASDVPKPATIGASADAFGSLMRSGHKLQEDYARGMTAVFQRFAEPSQSSE